MQQPLVILDLCLSKTPSVKSHNREAVVKLRFRVIVKKGSRKNLSVDCRPSVGQQSADCRPFVGRQVFPKTQTISRPTVGR